MFCSVGRAAPAISTPPPQASGQTDPAALPSLNVKPEITVVKEIEPVTVNTR